MVYNCFTVKSVFIPKQLLLTYKIRHYSFQVLTDKLVPIRKNTVSLPFNSLLIYSKKYWRPSCSFYCKKTDIFLLDSSISSELFL